MPNEHVAVSNYLTDQCRGALAFVGQAAATKRPPEFPGTARRQQGQARVREGSGQNGCRLF